MNSTLKIGFFGFGCVGQGLYDILQHNDSLKAQVVKICVKNRTKQRPIDQSFFTFDKNDILQHPEINLVVEMIDNADEAYEIVKEALIKGKNVVTANKKMLAEHLEELVGLQHQYGVSLLYEAAACGSIPIIRTLEEYYDNELLFSLGGIFNGSTNYILTKIIEENLSYDNALKQAQDLGFAETDPLLDVGAFDPKYKLVILALHAYGLIIKPEEVFNFGIQNFSVHDLKYAKEKGYKVKLMAHSQKVHSNTVALYLMPQFVDASHPLYYVENETNGVIVQAAFSQKQIFVGKGAGGHPTGSAVLSDISATLYDYHYAYKKLKTIRKSKYTTELSIEIYLRYHNKADLALFEFEEVLEQYLSAQTNYVIGHISLKNLLAIKEQIINKDVFIASTGKVIEPIAEGLLEYEDMLLANTL